MRPPGLWIPLLRLGGVGVYVDLLVLLLVGLVFSARPGGDEVVGRLGLVGIVLGSVLLHELAHALAARWRGLRVAGIYLHLVPFAYVQRGRPADELRVALAGPLANLLLALVLLAWPGVRAGFVWDDPALWLERPAWVALGVNAMMGVLNLVPALPADGGRALRAALMLRFPAATAYAYTAWVGVCVGVILIVVGLTLWPSSDGMAAAVAGVFLVLVACRERRRLPPVRSHDESRTV